MHSILGKAGLVAFLALFTFSIACGGGDDRNNYPDIVVNNYMSSCVESGGTPSQCRCTLDVFEDEYTLEEFIGIEQKLDDSEDLPPELISVITKCLR